MIAFLFSPIGRWIAGVGAILLILGGFYVKIRLDAENRVEAKGNRESLTRTQDAVRAGDNVDTSPDGLRADDKYRRN